MTPSEPPRLEGPQSAGGPLGPEQAVPKQMGPGQMRPDPLGPNPLGPEPSPRRIAGAVPYMLTVLALAVVLAALFLIVYELLAQHPEHAPGLIWRAYGALSVGMAALGLQALLVGLRLVRPLREKTAETVCLRAALANVSHHDPLTGVLNRVAFDHSIVLALEGLKRYGAGFSGILADVDGFRAVNDAYGYETGDQVLHELAHLLKTHIRQADSLYRWRSGRFLILAQGIDAGQAARMAEKLREVVSGHAFTGGVRLGLSLGVSAARAEDAQESFVGRLKTGLARAKEGGGNAVAQA